MKEFIPVSKSLKLNDFSPEKHTENVGTIHGVTS